MNKEKYISPEMEIIEFEYEDVIITSGEKGEVPIALTGGIYQDPITGEWHTGQNDE